MSGMATVTGHPSGPPKPKLASTPAYRRGTVSRHTQTLVALRILVHDLDEHGIWVKHAYDQPGVWAYVYHVDVLKLTDPVLVEQWEKERDEHIQKCRVAGAKNTRTKWAKGNSGNQSGLSKIQQQEQRDLRHPTTGICDTPDHRDFRQTRPQGFSINPTTGIFDTDPTLNMTPATAPPNDHPSARSRAVSQKQVSELVSEDAPFAPLTTPSTEACVSDNLDHDPNNYDKRYDTRPWKEAENILYTLKLPIVDKNTILLLDLVDELEGRGVGIGRSGDWAELFREVWRYNQVHKKGGLLWFTLGDMAKGLRSANERNILAQWDRHMENGGCKLCMDKTPITDAELDKYACPPGSAPPPVELCEHGADKRTCATCEAEYQRVMAERYRCQHGGDSRTCDDCIYPKNCQCQRRECGKRFHSPTGRGLFCSQECSDLNRKRNEELAAKYAKPEPMHTLAAFLDGDETAS